MDIWSSVEIYNIHKTHRTFIILEDETKLEFIMKCTNSPIILIIILDNKTNREHANNSQEMNNPGQHIILIPIVLTLLITLILIQLILTIILERLIMLLLTLILTLLIELLIIPLLTLILELLIAIILEIIIIMLAQILILISLDNKEQMFNNKHIEVQTPLQIIQLILISNH